MVFHFKVLKYGQFTRYFRSYDKFPSILIHESILWSTKIIGPVKLV